MKIPNITTKQRLEEIRANSRPRLSDRKIGSMVGLNQSNVWRLRTGTYKRTTDEVGIRIANLHAQIVNRKNNASQ